MASGQDLLIEQITKKWIVTRHKGAAEFINVLGYEGISAQHLDLGDIGEYEGGIDTGIHLWFSWRLLFNCDLPKFAN